MSSFRSTKNPFLRLQRQWEDAVPPSFTIPANINGIELTRMLAASGFQVSIGDAQTRTYSYYDTQDGKLFKASTRLFFIREESNWTLRGPEGTFNTKGEERVPVGDGELQVKLKNAIKDGPLLNLMIVSTDNTPLLVSTQDFNKC